MSQPDTQPSPEKVAIAHPHALSAAQALDALTASTTGLANTEVARRLQQYGANALPRKSPPGLLEVFLNQFKSPLIYVLVAAAVVSLLIREFSDAIFIGAVQEYSAQRSADALQKMMTTRVRVLREGDAYEVDSEDIVPGDIVLLESGERVPADMRLLECHNLEIDESLLSGESIAVIKHADALLAESTVLGDRVNMAYAGSLVNRGRAKCYRYRCRDRIGHDCQIGDRRQQCQGAIAGAHGAVYPSGGCFCRFCGAIDGDNPVVQGHAAVRDFSFLGCACGVGYTGRSTGRTDGCACNRHAPHGTARCHRTAPDRGRSAGLLHLYRLR